MKEKLKRLFLMCIILPYCFFCGCSNRILMQGSSENPTLLPDKRRIGAAIKDAVFDPYFGITAAALIAVTATGKDKQISSYATRHTPVFGSTENAKLVSDIIVFTSAGIAALTYSVRYFPLQEQTYQNGGTVRTEFGIPPALYAPAVAAETALVSGALTLGTTGLLKITVNRERPNLSDTHSFPSLHTSAAAAANAYSARTLSGMSLPRSYSYPAYAALTTLTLATAWGRVEGGKHYPTDVMAGALIGTFLGNAAYKAFLGPYRYVENFNLQIVPQGAAAAATVTF